MCWLGTPDQGDLHSKSHVIKNKMLVGLHCMSCVLNVKVTRPAVNMAVPLTALCNKCDSTEVICLYGCGIDSFASIIQNSPLYQLLASTVLLRHH